MSHMVIFRTPEGKPGYQPAETVEDAVEIVERLRNDDGVENVRIFRLEELSFEYRPYYKVELAGAGQEPGGAPTASESFAPALGGETVEAFAAPDVEVSDETESDDDSTGAEASDERPQEPAAEHPPWAAPPPPPPPPGAESPFGSEPAAGEADDDEFSGAGQRRGLFGR